MRVHVRVDAKTLQEAHDEFIAHLFHQLDIKAKGYLSAADAERAPLVSHIKSGAPGSIFGAGFYGMQSGTGPTKLKGNKITQKELAAYYAKEGLAPLQLQPQAQANAGGMMAMLGGGGQVETTVDQVGKAIFARLDSGGQGKLTRKELAAASDILLRLDANDDEMISIPELVPPLSLRRTRAA